MPEPVHPPLVVRNISTMTLKRSASNITPPSIRRSKPTCVGFTPFAALNVEDGEIVYQACLLVSGQCHDFGEFSEGDYVSVQCTDGFTESSAAQNWPTSNGNWKSLVMLSPGANYLNFELHHAGVVSSSHKLIINYVPLLQLPPLHLAIMVAKDSPLLIDCLSSKQGSISSAHSGIDAAIAKFRTTAYMWQALTAEDMRQKGLGRRSFRLDEEWNLNTTTERAFRAVPNAPSIARTVAKVHIVRTEKTVAELRDPNYAQQNSSGLQRDELHNIFEDALRGYGGPFASINRPVVAGLILDSTYSPETKLIHAHAALGCHRHNGLSLGIFGSHLTYSWPRFFEEIPACLLDRTPTDDTVGNDNGECNSLREACFVGQGAFLHEVGHAFGADHTTGIMARGYSKHWPRNFLSRFETENDCKWDLQDALRFKSLPHFRTPGDKLLSKLIEQALIDIKPEISSNSDGISVSCSAGIAFVETSYNGKTNRTQLMDWKAPCTSITLPNIDQSYDRTKPLSLEVLAMNGKSRTIKDVWRFLKQVSIIRIPGSDIVLRKQSVRSDALEADSDESHYTEWALLIQEKGSDGQLHHATSIDLRVGCWMDGAVVYYADGHTTNCGVPNQRSYGGHASQKQDLPSNVNIAKVEIRKSSRAWGSLWGVRMTLENGTRWGELHDVDSEDCYEQEGETGVLQPAEGEKIVGFYGQSCVGGGYCCEFGIITAPKERELPDVVYDMSELQNKADDQ